MSADSTDPRQLSHIRKPSPELQKNIDTLLAGFEALHVHFNKKIADQMILEGFRFPDLLEHSLRSMMTNVHSIRLILTPRYQYIKDTGASDLGGRNDHSSSSAEGPTQD